MTSNGLAFSLDGRTLYSSDTPRFVIYRYDYDLATGAAANRREFLRIEPTPTDRGRPDGAAVDVEDTGRRNTTVLGCTDTTLTGG